MSNMVTTHRFLSQNEKKCVGAYLEHIFNVSKEGANGNQLKGNPVWRALKEGTNLSKRYFNLEAFEILSEHIDGEYDNNKFVLAYLKTLLTLKKKLELLKFVAKLAFLRPNCHVFLCFV